jgi:molecular chaperone DnaK (HSP70)
MSININTISTKNTTITVGIDLGTDKCCITYQDNIGRPFIITDDSNFKISSIIGVLSNGLLVGNEISKDLYFLPMFLKIVSANVC